MNYLDIKQNDIANGIGIRVSLWVAGCDIYCPECHNPESWDYTKGIKFTHKTMNQILEYLEPDHIDGITITGGHPLAPYNIDKVRSIVRSVRCRYFDKKSIWLYTGYELTYEDIIPTIEKPLNTVLRMCDVVVDGPYVAAERDITLPWCGSRNQRVIDIKKTINNKEITLLT